MLVLNQNKERALIIGEVRIAPGKQAEVDAKWKKLCGKLEDIVFVKEDDNEEAEKAKKEAEEKAKEEADKLALEEAEKKAIEDAGNDNSKPLELKNKIDVEAYIDSCDTVEALKLGLEAVSAPLFKGLFNKAIEKLESVNHNEG